MNVVDMTPTPVIQPLLIPASGESVQEVSPDELREQLDQLSVSLVDQAGNMQSELAEYEDQIVEHIMRQLMDFKRMAMEELMGIRSDSNVSTQSLLEELSLYGSDGNMAQMENISFRAAQSLDFSFTGTFVSEDGQESEFNVEVSMTQTLAMEQRTTDKFQKWMELHDPLVIDYAGNGVDLSDQKFSFDLDSDGESDQISLLNKGSGFLVLDRNENGMVDNGMELFGTKSGDGFKDLSLFDEDQNGVIDKSDSVFDKLRVWKRDESGDNSLVALGEVGIGAISLNAKKNQYDFLSAQGELNGRLQKSSQFLKNDGNVGGIHHIDFAKQASSKAYATAGNAVEEAALMDEVSA